MRMNSQPRYRRDTTVQFPCSQVILPAAGRWQLIMPFIQGRGVYYCIWHESNPILQFRNTYTARVIQMISDEVPKWLDPFGMDPLMIPDMYKISLDHICVRRREMLLQDAKILTIKILFNHASIISQAYATRYKVQHPCYCIWGGGKVPSYPEPDLDHSLQPGPYQRVRLQLIHSILRYPGLYDGGADYMFERMIHPGIRLLFEPWCRAPLAPQADHTPGPLIVISESAELTDDTRSDMAKNAYPIIRKLQQQVYCDKENLPAHGFVYGIHMSRTHVSIFAHFALTPGDVSDEQSESNFCQILLSRFYLSHLSCVNDQDDLFLWRWRLLTALFAVLRHTEMLQDHFSKLCQNPTVTSETLSYTRPVRLERIVPRDSFASYHKPFARTPKIARTRRRDLKHLRTLWNVERFPVPGYWIPSEPLSISLQHSWPNRGPDRSIYLWHQLTSVLFSRITGNMQPLYDDSLSRNSISKGPDFLLPIHCPKAYFQGRSYVADKAKVSGEGNSLPQYSRVRDFLAMAPCTWEDINLFFANVFAGFSAYSVQWEPTIRYPAGISQCVSEICTVDFALAAQPIPPTTDATLERAPSMPLTISSPGLFLGIRSDCLETDGHSVSRRELSELCSVMKPHLSLLRLRRQYPDIRVSPHFPSLDIQPTLFCTYLKKGFVHILAFAYADDHTSVVSGHLLDSLPLALYCDTDKDVLDRMRVAMALLTIQRQVVRISESWRAFCWPMELLADEHEAIVEVTGISTPAPSVGVPPRDSPLWDEWDDVDYSLEDDAADIKRRIRTSVALVTPWLANVEPSKDTDL